MCNQPREAMGVYRRMLEEGYSPNATTYNALISAYGKAGQLDKVGARGGGGPGREGAGAGVARLCMGSLAVGQGELHARAVPPKVAML